MLLSFSGLQTRNNNADRTSNKATQYKHKDNLHIHSDQSQHSENYDASVSTSARQLVVIAIVFSCAKKWGAREYDDAHHILEFFVIRKRDAISIDQSNCSCTTHKQNKGQSISDIFPSSMHVTDLPQRSPLNKERKMTQRFPSP